MRADQVLASELFGYFIDADPRVEEYLRRASRLAGKGNRRTKEEEDEYLEITKYLKGIWPAPPQTFVEREIHNQLRAKLREDLVELDTTEKDNEH